MLSPLDERAIDMAKRAVSDAPSREHVARLIAEVHGELRTGAPCRRITDRLLALAERCAELEQYDPRGRGRSHVA